MNDSFSLCTYNGELPLNSGDAIANVSSHVSEWKDLTDKRKGPSTLHYFYATSDSGKVMLATTGKQAKIWIENDETDTWNDVARGAIKYANILELFYLGTILGVEGGVSMRRSLIENGDPVVLEKVTLKSEIVATRVENAKLKAALLESGIDLDAILNA
jgi:hypothetical protein